MIEYLIAAALQGGVSKIQDCKRGRIGIYCSQYGNIDKVFPYTPAALSGLVKGDQIIHSGNSKGTKECLGPAGEWVEITYIHEGHEYTTMMERIDVDLVRDYSKTERKMMNMPDEPLFEGFPDISN